MDARAERFNRLVGATMKSEIGLKPGYSVRKAAQDIGIDRSTLTRYLDGTRQVPVSVVQAVAAVVGVPPEHIIAVARMRLEEEISQGITPGATPVQAAKTWGNGLVPLTEKVTEDASR